MHKGYQVLLALLFLGLCAALFNNWPANSGEWAGWVQALGSIGAILIAVWVSHRDNQNAVGRALAAEREEGQRAATALATELMVHWDHYQVVAGTAIESHEDDTPFKSYWLPPEHPFPMFHGYSGKMHLVASADLREQLVFAYSSFQTLYSSYRSNNKSMDELNEVNRLISQNHSQASNLGNVVEQRMSRYSKSIRNAHERTKHAVFKVKMLIGGHS
ncbi:hypothetical protein LMG3410_02102 [Achromobacter aegrifaciens]|uniref:hypothetical protein n=1 Tax=Achromobacter aegrifaciens TaxID=1287736 RepID=UPI0014651CDE|nr:hypothetical protein [Achromobacter aegrifaciens]CAB3857441.1 hypothetical protein LMG3410_02102 [Achromobacter aegrifaciens]